jgi:catechol 2,3-dioxygenase-like lactoylglutathione lyase family enzyme
MRRFIAVFVMAMAPVGAAVVAASGAVRAAETAGRPRIYGIAFVRVKVTDLEKSKAFYGGVLKLREGGAACGGVALPCFTINGEQHVELLKTDAADSGPFLPEIGLATDSVEKMLGYLTAKGVAASDIMRLGDGRRYVEVIDPEGHKIVFVERGKIAADSPLPGAISRKMIHAGFVVKDAKAESKFYEDVLGLKPYWHGGFKDGETNWYMLQVPNGDNWLEYMLLIPANADHKELGVQYHFSLGVKDIQAAAKELEGAGVKLPGPPIMGLDGKWQLTLYDPDWTRAEVMEFGVRGKVCCSEYTGVEAKP